MDPYTDQPIDAWQVHEEFDRPGLVATRRRFVGSPDAEVIGGGVNMKGGRGTPLVREGNIFLWGFAAPPSRMTEPGRDALANAIVYITDFAGQAPTVRFGVPERSDWRDIVASPYIEGRTQLARYFADDIVAACGEDKDAYRAYLEPRHAYLYVPVGSARFAIDADAEAWGLAVDDPALIERAIADGSEVGRRVLARYWPEDHLAPPRPTSVDAFRAMAGEVFFTENYGYRWVNDVPEPAPEAWQIDEAAANAVVAEPTTFAPAQFTGQAVTQWLASGAPRAERLMRGVAVVHARTLEGWHVTIEPGSTPMIPVSFDIALPEGCTWSSDAWVLDGDTSVKTGATVAGGTLRWTREFWIRSTPKGVHEIAGTVSFQACDEAMCLPPTAATVRMPFAVR